MSEVAIYVVRVGKRFVVGDGEPPTSSLLDALRMSHRAATIAAAALRELGVDACVMRLVDTGVIS